MAFDNGALFPTKISWASVSGIGFRTMVTELASGREQRVSSWSGGRMQFHVAYGIKTSVQLFTVQQFFRARTGSFQGFKFKDWLDFHSNPTDPTYNSSKGTKDQVIGVGDGSNKTFQLRKAYISGSTTVYRNITKPVSGKVDIWVNGVLQTEGADYTVDTSTGIITFTVAPTMGHQVDASFEFDVPVRFSDANDAFLGVSADAFNAGSIPDIVLVELLEEAGGHSNEFLYGGTKEVTINADLEADPDIAYLWRINASSSGLNVDMKNPDSYADGRPHLELVNSGSNTFTIRDEVDVTILSLAAGESAIMAIAKKNVSGDHQWFAV